MLEPFQSISNTQRELGVLDLLEFFLLKLRKLSLLVLHFRALSLLSLFPLHGLVKEVFSWELDLIAAILR